MVDGKIHAQNKIITKVKGKGEIVEGGANAPDGMAHCAQGGGEGQQRTPFCTSQSAPAAMSAAAIC